MQAARMTTHVLAGVCGVLLLLAIAQYLGLGRGYRWADGSSDSTGTATLGTIDKRPLTVPPASAFADIDSHPLFNEDRKPTPVGEDEGEDEAPPSSPLNIALTGVILDETHHVHIAMLQDKAKNQAIALKVGMPLEGDQASWTLVDVKPRGVVFKNAANETAEVELETAVTAARPPARPPPRTARNTVPGQRPGAANSRPETKTRNNADLARRIEERRRQMREEAEKLRNRGNNQPVSPKK